MIWLDEEEFNSMVFIFDNDFVVGEYIVLLECFVYVNFVLIIDNILLNWYWYLFVDEELENRRKILLLEFFVEIFWDFLCCGLWIEIVGKGCFVGNCVMFIVWCDVLFIDFVFKCDCSFLDKFFVIGWF